jgi:hypothetical protein
MEGYPY